MPDSDGTAAAAGGAAVAARETTYILAWTDPRVAGTEPAACADQALLQCLAKAWGYVQANAARASADYLWRQALGHLPLLTPGWHSSGTLRTTNLESLQQQAAGVVLDCIGADQADPAAAAVTAVVRGPGHAPGRLTVNIVQTAVIGPAAAGVGASIAQTVLDYTAAETTPPLGGTGYTWTLAQASSRMSFDYQTLVTDEAARQQWDQLMHGVDVDTVTSLPAYHRLDLQP